jgi:hypothetical protein
VEQTKAVYSPIDPKLMFAEILAEADRQANLTQEQMDRCVGAKNYDMRSYFAGAVDEMRRIVARYETTVAAVDMTNEVRDKLKDAVLGRAFYNPAMGRILTAVESILVLAGCGTQQNKDASRELIRGAITAVQEGMKVEWESRWWELIKPQLQEIQMMSILEVGEGLGPKDKLDVFQGIQAGIYATLRQKTPLDATRVEAPTDAEEFSRLVAYAIVDGLERCGLVEERPEVTTSSAAQTVNLGYSGTPAFGSGRSDEPPASPVVAIK